MAALPNHYLREAKARYSSAVPLEDKAGPGDGIWAPCNRARVILPQMQAKMPVICNSPNGALTTRPHCAQRAVTRT
jgi:hypothetical protein